MPGLPHKSDFNEERLRENFRVAGQRLDELQDGYDTLVVGPSPSGAAGGTLNGTYPNPGLATSVAGDGLTNSASVLSVNVDGSTIETNADTLRVKDGGITAAKVAADVATQAELDAGLATKADDSAVVHDTGNETVAGTKTFSDGTKTPYVESLDSTTSVSLGTDSLFLTAGSAFIVVDGINGFLQVYAVFAATGGFSLGLIELPLTGDYTLAASGAESQRILVDPDANGYTIEMAAQLSAYGEVIFENVSATYSFDVGDEPISAATVAGGPINIPAGTEKKFYFRNGTNEWRETTL